MNTIWVKSSLSFSNGNCVEVASLPGGAIGVRNSRDPRGPVLRFTPEEWGTFVGRVRLGNSTGPEGVRLIGGGPRAGSPAAPAAIPGARSDPE